MKPKYTKELKALKREAHDLCDLIWGNMHSSFGNIAAQYSWLQANTRTGHIGTLTEIELKNLIKILRKKAKKNVHSVRSDQQQWWL